MNLVLIVQFYKADHSVYTDRQTDRQADIARRTGLVILIKNLYTLFMYFKGSETLPFTCYILFKESSIPFYSTINRYN